MIYGDLRDGTLESIREGPCARPVARCSCCGRPLAGAKAALLCDCAAQREAIIARAEKSEKGGDVESAAAARTVAAAITGPTPGDGCGCQGPHDDPAPGTTRVTLAAWPVDGYAGPWRYDAATRAAMPDRAASRALWLALLARACETIRVHKDSRRRLLLAGASTAEADAAIAAASAEADRWAKRLAER